MTAQRQKILHSVLRTYRACALRWARLVRLYTELCRPRKALRCLLRAIAARHQAQRLTGILATEMGAA